MWKVRKWIRNFINVISTMLGYSPSTVVHMKLLVCYTNKLFAHLFIHGEYFVIV